jgi:hypothetical protein
MVLQYYAQFSHNSCQCLQSEIASKVCGLDCRSAPFNCDKLCWPDLAYARLSYQCRRTETPFDLDDIKAEIDAGRPIETLFSWTQGGSHVAVVSGYFANDELMVLDPYYGLGHGSYDWLRSFYGRGEWLYTFDRIAPLNGPPPQT